MTVEEFQKITKFNKNNIYQLIKRGYIKAEKVYFKNTKFYNWVIPENQFPDWFVKREFYTVDEVMKITKLRRITIYQLIKDGVLEAYRFHTFKGVYFIYKLSIPTFLRKN